MDKRTGHGKPISHLRANAGATKMDKVENLECLYQGDDILEKEWVTDSHGHSILGSTVSGES